MEKMRSELFSSCCRRLLFALIIVLIMMCLSNDVVHVVQSYPYGAGGCAGGGPAVGGAHLTAQTVIKKTFQQKRVKVSVGGVTIASGRSGVVPYGKALNVKITGMAMKGILIRLRVPSGISTKDVLIPRGNGLQRATACKDPVVGVTHKNNTEYNIYQSVVKFTQSTPNVAFDITIVYENENKTKSESIYAYGRIKVNFTKAP